MWTEFMDMHSGGDTKIEPYEYIFIEAPEDEAKVIFYNRFHRNPERVTCTCCGGDYSIHTYPNLAQATAYERGCAYGYINANGIEITPDDWYALPLKQQHEWKGQYLERGEYADREVITLEDYMKRDNVLFIPASCIEPHERHGKIPSEGYIWIESND